VTSLKCPLYNCLLLACSRQKYAHLCNQILARSMGRCTVDLIPDSSSDDLEFYMSNFHYTTALDPTCGVEISNLVEVNGLRSP
jgi:hypothetical protein